MTKKMEKLHILWTNDNMITAEKMVFMYGINAKSRGWRDEVTIILWVAPVKLAAENKLIQNLIEEAKLEGVHVTACQACAEQLGVAKEHGIKNSRGIVIELPLTHEDLGFLTGAHRVSITRAMTALKQAGKIILEGRRLILAAEAI